MLADANVVPTIAIRDIAVSRAFYEGKLGLNVSKAEEGELQLSTGNTPIVAYVSANTAGTNKATCFSWIVEDIKSTIQELEANGIEFLTYDMPGVIREGVIHILDGEKSAWFSDPDGNILAVSQHI